MSHKVSHLHNPLRHGVSFYLLLVSFRLNHSQKGEKIAKDVNKLVAKVLINLLRHTSHSGLLLVVKLLMLYT